MNEDNREEIRRAILEETKAWSLQTFFRKAYFAMVSRGAQDGGRPVRLTKAGVLDPSLLAAADILTLVKTVDGTGSGLDADTVDGAHYAVAAWTPAVTFGGAAVGVTYGTGNGAVYTKIGRYVHVAFRLMLTSKGSSAGAAVLTGLPFAISSTSPSSSNMRFYTLAYFVNPGTSPAGFVVIAGVPGSSTITLTILTTAATGSNLDDTHFSNTSDLRGELWYLTD